MKQNKRQRWRYIERERELFVEVFVLSLVCYVVVWKRGSSSLFIVKLPALADVNLLIF